MRLDRTTDYELVHSILTAPGIYEHIGDDFSPRREDFRVNTHPLIWYVTAGAAHGLFGLFCLFPQNRICWEVHVVMLPDAKTSEKWAAARQLVPWLRHTECRRLTAAVPGSNKPAINYGTHGIGMHYVGTHERAYLRHGELQDLILLGVSVFEGGD